MTTRPHLLDRKLLFVTGKGGVGKSTIASSLALLAANEGKRTLVCEVDAKGNLAEFYGTKPLRFAPTEVQSGLFAMTMDTEESLREYLRLQLHLPLISRLGPLAKTFDFVATAAPGVKEILTVGKLAYEVRERNYDMVVVDASATGHVVGQLASPVAMKELVSVGIVRQQTEWMLNILTDPAQTGVVVVATPEEMPVNETIELIDRLDSETDINVAAVMMVTMATYGGLGAAMNAGSQIQSERSSGWFRQLMLTSLAPGQFVLAKILTAIAVLIPAIGTVFLAGAARGVRLDAGTWAASLGLIVTALLPMIVFGLVIALWFKPQTATAVTTLAMLALAMLGGLWVPLQLMPEVMQTIGKLLPSYWASQIGGWPLVGGGFPWQGVGVLAVWLVALAGLGGLGYRRAIRTSRR